jgi:hypothetical protein
MTVHHGKVHEIFNFVSKESARNIIEFLAKNDAEDENFGSPCFPWVWDVIKANHDEHSLTLTQGITNETITELRDKMLIEVERIFSKEVKFVNLKGQHHPRSASTAPSAYFDVGVWLLLNDDYEGGEFIMPSLDLSITPEIGSLLIFEEGEEAKHGVSLVTSGNRYSLQGTFRFKDSHPSKFRWHNNKKEQE